ncbi:MAG: SLC13 family permease [Rothia sp. (in: high G+C Gram-positive bacteria)]|nr:SLC13 family permease [Rothia sp. (in: high G+C Gram-positive bacteria)]
MSSQNIIYRSNPEPDHTLEAAGQKFPADPTAKINRNNPAEHSFISTSVILSALVATVLIGLVCWAGLSSSTLQVAGALTLSIFIIAIWAWIFTPLPDTYVALAAAVLLVLTGVSELETLTRSLGNSTIWLLVAAVVMAQGVSQSGLATRWTAHIISRAQSSRSLFYSLTLALFLTAFLIPSTSGRAALALPIFTALAKVLAERDNLVKALSILIPSVVLLSAVSSYIGAGAHLITDEILGGAGYETIGFLRWMLLGSGLGLLASLMCTELVLRLFLSAQERSHKLTLEAEDLLSKDHRMSQEEKNVLLVLAVVVTAWCTEPLHGMDTVLVALLGALAMTAPQVSGVSLGAGLKKAPWPLLVFMAATLALGSALVDSGAAAWLGKALFSPLAAGGHSAGYLFIAVITAISTAAHLVIQSRSARSAVLVPLIMSAALPLGVNPVAAAFVSTAAAGFCHTLTSSAKPVALFSHIENAPVYGAKDLLKLSAWLAPLHGILVLIFAFIIWPLLGLHLF